jgi:hypothetical protein
VSKLFTNQILNSRLSSLVHFNTGVDSTTYLNEIPNDDLIFINSKNNNSLIFKNIGLFLFTYIFNFKKNIYDLKFILKKKIFSFLYPNEVRNKILLQKKKIVFYRLIFKNTSDQLTDGFSFLNFKGMYNDFYKMRSLNKQNFERNLLNNLDFSSIKLKNPQSLFSMYDRSIDDIFYSKEFEDRGVDDSFRV